MTKLQLTLTEQEVEILSVKAARLGYSLTRYVKFLLGKAAAATIDPFDNIPTFPMSTKREKIVENALKDDAENKTFVLNDPNEILDW